MSIKQKLLEEAKTINANASVELDTIFESTELSDEVKSKFSIVFESVVKQHAIALAEKHIDEISDMAEELAEQKSAEKEAVLIENVDKYFNHITDTWLSENKVQVDRDIKSNLFESLLGSLKVAFIEHNITVPTESVDVVAELEEELRESNVELNKTLDKVTALNESMLKMQRDSVIAESTKNLNDVQKEKVLSLSEGIAFGDKFKTKIEAIVEMVGVVPATKVTQIEENLNFEQTEQELSIEEQQKEELVNDDIDPIAAQYLNY